MATLRIEKLVRDQDNWPVIEDSVSTDIKEESSTPGGFGLYQNYPNPFNPSTTIKFFVPSVETLHATSLQRHVLLTVYDVLGNEIKTLVNEQKSPGNHEITFNGSSLSSGVYFYRLQSNGFISTKKFILLK